MAGHKLFTAGGALINRVLQSLARLKLRLLRGRNLNRFAGPRVTTDGSRAVRNTERTKTHETNVATRFELISNTVKYRIDSFDRIGLRETRTAGNFSYEIVFIQCEYPPSEFGKEVMQDANYTRKPIKVHAVWAQRMDVLFSYENPLKITAKKFPSNKIHPTDIHTMDDLISVHRENQYDLIW